MPNDFWDKFYGHEKARRIFESLVLNNKIPSGIILSGPPGIGADFLALKFAHLLRLFTGTGIPPADTLPLRFEEPDVKYIFPLMRGANEDAHEDPFSRLTPKDIDAIKNEIRTKNNNPYYELNLPRANEIKINSIRSIKNYLSLNFSEYIHRTIIISAAEYMSDTTQNALLKSLEEPPEHVTMILTTTDSSKLLSTIRSRCWEIKLSHLPDTDMNAVLQEYFNFTKEEIKTVLPFSYGNINEAVRLMDTDLERITLYGIDILRYAMAGQFLKGSELMETMFKELEKDSLDIFIKFLINWFSDAYRYSSGKADFILNDYAETFRKFADRYPETNYREILDKLENLQYTMDNSYMNRAGIISKIFYDLRSVTTPHIKISN